jgi:Tol biopolymer transport system component
VFFSNASGNRDIYVVRADASGLPKRLTTDPSIDGDPDWSADGKSIYFASDRSGQQAIWKVPAHGGEAVPVPHIDGGLAVESPDGKFLYYARTGKLWRVPIGGAEGTLVVDSLHPEGGLVVTNEGIYFISIPDEKGVSHIRFKDLGKRETRTIAPIKGRVFYGLTVSPDRRSFLYTQSDETGSDLMLVENFR